MEFDKSRILTAVTADQAKAGDIGWFADTISKMERTIQEKQPLRLAHIEGGDKVARFYSERCNLGWHLFYPAPYSYLQERWVKENGLEVGDMVKIIAGWHRGDRGYKTPMAFNAEGSMSKVVGISNDKIELVTMNVPYFAIEKIKEEPEPEYRPFANAEEFKPYRDRWLKDPVGTLFMVYRYDDYRVIGGIALSYKELLGSCTFDDGSPAGVRV